MNRVQLNKNYIIVISFSIIIIDQLTKAFAINTLNDGESIIIISKFIKFTLVRNTGAAFSILSNATPILGLLSLVVSITLLFWIYKKSPFSFWYGLGLAFLLGGTIGNGLDRWRLGFVNDFIEIIPISFPIFNFADIAINVSIIFLLISKLKKKNAIKII